MVRVHVQTQVRFHVRAQVPIQTNHIRFQDQVQVEESNRVMKVRGYRVITTLQKVEGEI